MKKLAFLGIASVLAAAASPASATIIITASPGAVQPPENVMADTGLTGTTVLGTTNQTNTLVTVQSNESLTTTSSNGQSRFSATDQSALDVGSIFLTSGGSFTLAEFNLFNAQGATSSVDITVNGVTKSYSLGNGENFFGFEATGGDVITSISFDTNGTGVADLRQLRIGGISAVPEPATWALMLIGFGAIGASMRRRRQTGHLPQAA